MAVSSKPRPVYRNINAFTDLTTYRLPLAGFVSILHRVSGLALFLMLPFLLYLFNSSLVSELSFSSMQRFCSQWWVKLLLSGLSWAYLHHFAAGMRHLFMDLHIGLNKDQAKHSAVAVFAVSLPLSALVIAKIWGAF